MIRWMFGAALGMAAGVGAAALPALAAPEPVVLEGTSWSATGSAKVKVQPLGKVTEDVAMSLSFLPGDTILVDAPVFTDPYEGPYTRSGPRGTKVTVELDADGREELRAFLEERIEEEIAARGLPLDVDVELTDVRFGGRVNRGVTKIGVKSRVRFEVSAIGVGTRRGSFKLKLKGAPTP